MPQESMNAERDSLRAALENPAPAAQPDATQSSSATSPNNEEVEQQNTDSQDTQNEIPKSGDILKRENQPKEETRFEKARRGRERLEDIRQKAEAEKNEARREREATQRLREELRAEIQQNRQSNSSPDALKFTPEQLNRAADYYESEAEKAYDNGDVEQAKTFRKNAREIRQSANQSAQREYQARSQRAQQEFVQAYSDCADKIIAENPDYGNPETEAFKAMDALLESAPVLTMIPDGFKWAHEILQLRAKAGDITALSPEDSKAYVEHGKAAGLLKKVTELKAEVDRLTKLTSLGKGSPAPLGKNDISSLPLARQREILRQKAGGD